MTSQSSQPASAPDSVGFLYMALSATGVIFLPTSAKLALQSGSDVLTVAFTRGIVASLILLVAAIAVGQQLRLPQRFFWHSLAVGIAGASFVYGVFGAILTINISLALLILFTYPMVIATYEHFFGTTRLLPAQWGWGIMACIGLGLIVGVRLDQFSFIGISLAMLAMLSSVVITLVNHRVVANTGSLVANLHMSLWGVLFFGLALWWFGEFLAPQTTLGWTGLMGNGIAYCVSWVAFFSGARILGTTRASMITLLEPPLAALFAWFIFDETFTLPQWIGFAWVLLSLFMFENLARKNR